MPHAKKPLPPVDVIRAQLRYDPVTGLLTRRATGKRAGTGDGPRKVSIGGHTYLEHYVIWALMTGVHSQWTVYHRNRDNADNRWQNLAEGVLSETLLQAQLRESRDGPKGVYSRHRRWWAELMIAGQRIRLGMFDTAEEARRAREAKAREAVAELAKMRAQAAGMSVGSAS